MGKQTLASSGSANGLLPSSEVTGSPVASLPGAAPPPQ